MSDKKFHNISADPITMYYAAYLGKVLRDAGLGDKLAFILAKADGNNTAAICMCVRLQHEDLPENLKGESPDDEMAGYMPIAVLRGDLTQASEPVGRVVFNSEGITMPPGPDAVAPEARIVVGNLGLAIGLLEEFPEFEDFSKDDAELNFELEVKFGGDLTLAYSERHMPPDGDFPDLPDSVVKRPRLFIDPNEPSEESDIAEKLRKLLGDMPSLDGIEFEEDE